MWPYLALGFAIIFLQLFSFTNKNMRSIAFYVGLLLLFFFAALRGNGTDYITYLTRGQNIWEIRDAFSSSLSMEPGYGILYWIANRLSFHPQFVIASMNLLSIGFLALFIKKLSPDCVLSLLLFLPMYFQFDMHAARIAVAISITAYSSCFASERKVVKFIFFVTLASLFHKTAWLVLILYGVVLIRINIVYKALMIWGMYIFQMFANLDEAVIAFFRALHLDSFAARYSVYTSSTQYGYEMSLLDPRVLLLIGTWAAGEIILKKPTREQRFVIDCCFLGALVYLVFSNHTFIAYRLGAYFNIYTIILIPQILQRMAEVQNHSNDPLGLGLQKRTVNCTVVYSIYALYTIGIIYYGYIASGVEYRLFDIRQ